VIVGFVATGYLVFILLICYYFVVYDPKNGTAEGARFEEGRLRDAEVLLHPRRLNQIDLMVISGVKSVLNMVFRGWSPFSSLDTDWEEVLSLVCAPQLKENFSC
jgi:hypothetical protein